MINGLLNQMRLQASLQSNSRATTRLAIVTSFDPSTYTAQVMLQPEDDVEPSNSLTGWLPVFSPWVGNGWGLFCPPSPGDLVEVQFQEGCWETGFVCLRGYNDISLPLAVGSGEFWLVHKTGSFIKITNDGNISISTDQDLEITTAGNLVATVQGDLTASITGTVDITADGDITASSSGNVSVTASDTITATAPTITLNGNVTVNGDLNVTGNITDLNGANGSLENIRTVYNSHIHTDPQGGDTGLPSPQIT
jgi:phage baseplate assembly protein gpV